MGVTQITVWSKNRPGNLARITGALAARGINLNGIYASDARGKGAIRLLVSNAARARAVVKAAGYRVSVEPVVLLRLTDRPGQLARVAAKLARARINVSYLYATVSGGASRVTIVLGVTNAAAARRALR